MGELPKGYTRLEYIEASGKQYIDTGFKPNNDTRLTAKIAMTATSKSLYCLGANDGTNFFRMFSQSGGTGVQNFYGTASHTLTQNIKEAVTVEQNKNVATVGSSSYTFEESTFSINCNLFLFTDNTNGIANTSCPASMKLYSCQIYDNETLVRDFLPCIRDTGEVGMYDLAGGGFYGNAGTGAFLAGPAILDGYAAQEAGFKGIADAIREKEGSAGTIPANDFAARILALPSGGGGGGMRLLDFSNVIQDHIPYQILGGYA